MLKTLLVLLTLAAPSKAADVYPAQQVSVIITGGTDPTKLPLTGGTLAGPGNLNVEGQVLVGTTTNNVFTTSGPFTVQGRNAEGAIATFASSPGTVGSYVLIISSKPGGGAVTDGAGVIVSTAPGLAGKLFSLAYDGASADVVLSGGIGGNYGEFYLSSNGSATIDAEDSGVINLLTEGGNINVTPSSGNRLVLTLAGGGTFRISGASAPSSGKALCRNASGDLSACTSAVDASGNCTCP